MASNCHKRNTKLLYADLFKSHESNNNNIILDGSSSSSCDSSSSGFTTPFGSELGSFGSEDEEFMAELTRQMAECMLKEEEEEEKEEETDDNPIYEDFEASGPVKNYMSQRYMDSSSINNFKNGLYSTPFYAEDQISHFQVNQLKNQPPVTKQGWSVYGVKGGSSTVLAQQKQVRKTEQNYIQYRGKGHVGSGMKAIFLGESGSSNGSSGTGVFLPRSPHDPTQVKKKSGCSTVLIPTRVLQTLELHFSKFSDSTTPLSRGGSRGVGGRGNESSDNYHTRDKCKRSQQNGDPKLENCMANEEEEMQLPQEWTY